ncbi:hypothetical protein OGAPHI_002331 [Ogataea philodendri]|uniref:Mediator of RNA polymerase II transcription subunit 21 n=1 Tax=Ogataea philodendri TaxID=1378263 RepID=A0A9P8PC45_9ASCO|nr:uncharacterized protein OGAPHI_002331 [Ogataea philodendri]KAH3668577.1 hypothetical protein OGAPHI_002331 [Ogataea philodendri]
MTDRLTQLQICLDQLSDMFFASLSYVDQNHIAVRLTEGDEMLPDPDHNPPSEADFKANLVELTSDIILKTKQILTIIDTLPGVGVSKEEQLERIESLSGELRELEKQKEATLKRKEQLSELVDEMIIQVSDGIAMITWNALNPTNPTTTIITVQYTTGFPVDQISSSPFLHRRVFSSKNGHHRSKIGFSMQITSSWPCAQLGSAFSVAIRKHLFLTLYIWKTDSIALNRLLAAEVEYLLAGRNSKLIQFSPSQDELPKIDTGITSNKLNLNSACFTTVRVDNDKSPIWSQVSLTKTVRTQAAEARPIQSELINSPRAIGLTMVATSVRFLLEPELMVFVKATVKLRKNSVGVISEI